jgi:anti-sigma factor (TIGR02949 family)
VKAIDCETFRGLTYHFQADEVSESDRERYLEHMGACGACARYLETEESFARFLRKRIRREPAPPQLRARIRAELERSAPAGGVGLLSRLWSPSVVAAAATLVLALLIGPTLPKTGFAGVAAGEVVRVMRAATIVDLQCDRAGKSLEFQLRCRHERHFNALRVADGQYWNLNLSQLQARDIVLDPGRRGERVVVEGDYYPRLQTLRVKAIRGPEQVSL